MEEKKSPSISLKNTFLVKFYFMFQYLSTFINLFLMLQLDATNNFNSKPIFYTFNS